MRVRLVVENLTYVAASAVVTTAAVASAILIVRRINRLDLVAVLKTRD
jgi:putative ABC transport system permease protein